MAYESVSPIAYPGARWRRGFRRVRSGQRGKVGVPRDVFLDYLTSDERFARTAGRAAPGLVAVRPELLRALRAGGGLIRAAEAPGWLVVVPDAEQAARLAAELAVYLERDVETLPARGVLYGADVAPAAHVLGQRQRALAALEQGGGVVVADAVALLERFIPLALQPRPLRAGARAPRSPSTTCSPRSPASGYERAEQVRERGEFAVRGGLVDVYPSTGDPVRAEFWGDTVESLRRFSVFSQRAVAEVERCLVTTAIEVDPTGDEVQAAVSQELAPWELAGRDETPDEAYRRAETRALARLVEPLRRPRPPSARSALCAWRASAPTTSCARWPASTPSSSTALPGEVRERFYLPLLEARRLLSDAVRARPRAARPARAVPRRPAAGGRARHHAPPSATCAAWPTTATGSSSSSATPARPAAPATG